MKRLLVIELEYDAELMHDDGRDKEALDWFENDVLGNEMILHSNEIGDSIGTCRRITDYESDLARLRPLAEAAGMLSAEDARAIAEFLLDTKIGDDFNGRVLVWVASLRAYAAALEAADCKVDSRPGERSE